MNGPGIRELFSNLRRENVETMEKKLARAENEMSFSNNNSVFELAIVEDVISNPDEYYNKPWFDDSQTYGGNPITLGQVYSGDISSDDNGNPLVSPIKNGIMLKFAPANSIKVSLPGSKDASLRSESAICFPFFSSHMMLPIKPGENVWIMKFNESVYYWICRQTSFRQVEDVNFTFGQRESNVSNSNLLNTQDENNFAHFDDSLTRGSRVNFQEIMDNSFAYKEEFTGEPVPRQSKKCGDFLFQGSNNSHIYLGQEKFQEENTLLPEAMTKQTSSDQTNQNRNPVSPAIDLAILRKAKEIFEIKKIIDENIGEKSLEGLGLGAVSGDRNNPTYSYYENEKARDRLGKDIFPEELKDSEIYNSIARIYISNAKFIDTLLGAEEYENENSAAPQDLESNDNYGTIVALSTNTRVVGTETIKINNVAGNSGIYFTPEGDVIVFANREGGAKIVLEAGGDVRIVPGPSGVLKLGSDDANGGVPLSEFSSRVAGNVTGTPIVSSAGGVIGVEGGTGVFSNKVLISK